MPKISADTLSARRREILDDARHCFATYGYEGATVRRLEAATGKSRGAIFHHFGDKETLFLTLAKQDAQRMAETVARHGLVEVMRDMLAAPEDYDFLLTRLEITRLIKTDPSFAARWKEHQEILDQAIKQRLQQGIHYGWMRVDLDVDALHTYLEVCMDGIIARLASGDDPNQLQQVLDLVESSLRRSPGVKPPSSLR
ncbi:TetR/AcrR family transcriptional regulator [Corynebacterium choanae]|uniref:HTH-type transcriptional repressor AcnR n=1 Tax=Corynebacterium choanae TaxID=1862358 RepID=A0A3G6J6M4_9CORY|nr:TetR/AcrR family transcriptional regulator [Corynebacterium choanae]AZA13606.1 HTH-type transcriptional repressor AcnR [Corynebacterium choanae]